MAATLIKVAYALFFFSFSMWIVILFSVCFQSGRWANPIQFPSYTFMGMFVSSAIASSIACMIIGFEYLGFGSELTRRTRALSGKRDSNIYLQTTSVKGDLDDLNGDYYVLCNHEDRLEDLNLLVLVSKKRKEKLRVSAGQSDETIVVINPSDSAPVQEQPKRGRAST